MTVLTKAIRKLDLDTRRIALYYSSGGALSQKRMFEFGQSDDPHCPFGGFDRPEHDHLSWYCTHPAIVEARKRPPSDDEDDDDDDEIKWCPSDINPDYMPPCLRIGLQGCGFRACSVLA